LDEELEKWYFQNSETIPLSIEFIQYILGHKIPCICVLNKIDKLNQYEERDLLAKLREVLLDFSIQEQGLDADRGLLQILPISMKEKENLGREELKKFIRNKANRLNMTEFDSRKELYKKLPIDKKR
jgi:GTP-binding protein EngB required for normal cell division